MWRRCHSGHFPNTGRDINSAEEAASSTLVIIMVPCRSSSDSFACCFADKFVQDAAAKCHVE